jgi:hypothetical protein
VRLWRVPVSAALRRGWVLGAERPRLSVFRDTVNRRERDEFRSLDDLQDSLENSRQQAKLAHEGARLLSKHTQPCRMKC